MKRRMWIDYQSDASDGECGGREVFEAEDAFRPKPTGLLNAAGDMIYRKPERIGFRLRREGDE